MKLTTGYKKPIASSQMSDALELSSNNSYLLLAGGGHKALSELVSPADLTNYVTIGSDQTITGVKTFSLAINADITGNANTASSVDWSGVTNKPTTIEGYGITDSLVKKSIITKNDFEQYVILLCKIGTNTTNIEHTINGTFWTTIGGSTRYQAAYINVHCSDWIDGHNEYYGFTPFGLGTKCRLVTCNYESNTYLAITFENVQACQIYFDGSYSNILFTPILYYTSKTGTINNLEIYNSISEVTSYKLAFTTDNVASASKLTSSAGSATLPIYFSDGVPVACTASSIFSNLSNIGNDLSITVAGQNRTLTVAYATNADDANTVNGYNLTASNGKYFGKIPIIETDGVTELGRYINFHYDTTTTSDYSTRLTVSGNHSNVVNLPSASGTLALISQIPTSLPANGGNADYATSADDADTVDGEHSSAFAHVGAHNNLIASGNEFTFVPSGFSGEVYLNYRTAGGTDGNITKYTFGNGKGGVLGTAIHSGNYNNYAPKLDGTGAYGTWGINISGNAATASKLQTARTLTIGNTGKDFDGTSNVSWSLSEIGAASSSHTHSYLPLSGGTVTGDLYINKNLYGPAVGNNPRNRYDSGLYFFNCNSSTISAYNFGLYQWNDEFQFTYRTSANNVHQGNAFIIQGSNGQVTFTNTPKVGSNIVWHSGNDGSGSGLDADTLDGKHASDFVLKSDHAGDMYETDDAGYVDSGGNKVSDYCRTLIDWLICPNPKFPNCTFADYIEVPVPSILAMDKLADCIKLMKDILLRVGEKIINRTYTWSQLHWLKQCSRTNCIVYTTKYAIIDSKFPSVVYSNTTQTPPTTIEISVSYDSASTPVSRYVQVVIENLYGRAYYKSIEIKSK